MIGHVVVAPNTLPVVYSYRVIYMLDVWRLVVGLTEKQESGDRSILTGLLV